MWRHSLLSGSILACSTSDSVMMGVFFRNSRSRCKIQIKGKMPLSVHFFRDAEADALNMERCQLDKATLIACAVKRLREDLGNVPDSGKKPSA